MWYEKAKKSILFDLHFPEWDQSILSNFDADKWVRELQRAHVDCGIFYAKDHFGNAYYNTKAGHKHRCIGDRDIFGEFVEACRRQGLFVSGYYSLMWENYIARLHPEWMVRDIAGNPVPGTWRVICVNTPYIDYVKEQLHEIMTGYDLDGLFFDMLFMGIESVTCFCENCRRLFWEKTGLELPTKPGRDEVWRAFLEFRYESVRRFGDEINRFVRAERPGWSIVYNYLASPAHSWKIGLRPIQNAMDDYGSTEAYPDFWGALYPSLQARFIQGVFEGKSNEIIANRFNRQWDYTVRPVEQLKWEIFTHRANGCRSFVVDQPWHDGQLDPIVYDRLGEVYSEMDEKEEIFGGEPIKCVGLYYSVKTRDLYAIDDHSKILSPFSGTYKALIESQIPVEIIFDENITLERLNRYPIIFLADVACLSDCEIDLFRKYVSGGGKLVATNNTSLYDADGLQRQDFGLADVFGARWKGETPTRYNFFKWSEPKLQFGLDPKAFILCDGPGNIVEPTTGIGLGDLHLSFFDRRPERWFSHNMHPPYKRVGPLVIENGYGQGKCIYVAASIAATYGGRYHLEEHRILMRNIVKALAPMLPVEVQAPLNVESVVNWQESKNRYVVHLIGYNPTKWMAVGELRPTPAMEEPPNYQATIRVNVVPRSVKRWGENGEFALDDGTLRVNVTNTHDAIMIEV